jgi:hypothetical protein
VTNAAREVVARDRPRSDVLAGEITHRAVAEAHGLDCTPLDRVVGGPHDRRADDLPEPAARAVEG